MLQLDRHRAETGAGRERSPAAIRAAQLHDLAFRVRCLRPDHRDPERFHAEKSEIEHALRQIAAEVR